MLLLPYDSFEINTKLTSREILEKLNYVTTPYSVSRYFKYPEHGKPFHGDVNESSFTIIPIPKNYRSSFIPIIEGKITDYCIKGKMRLNWFVTLLLTGIMIYTWKIGLAEFNNSSSVGYNPFLVLPVFLYLFALFAFKFDSRKARNYLNNLFTIGS